MLETNSLGRHSFPLVSKPDQVAIKMTSGFNLKPISEWQSLSIAERKELISSGKVQFLKAGEPLPLRDALAVLKNDE